MAIYLQNVYGFIAIISFWLINLFITQKLLVDMSTQEAQNSPWLISFMGLFVPVYFCRNYFPTPSNEKQHLCTQKKLFQSQCVASIICYIPTLVACMVIVNKPINFEAQPTLIFDNFQFNLCFIIVIAEGVISTFLSFSPATSKIILKFIVHKAFKISKQRTIEKEQTPDTSSVHTNEFNNPIQPMVKKQTKADRMSCPERIIFVIGFCCVLILVLLPIIVGIVLTLLRPDDKVIIFNKPVHQVAPSKIEARHISADDIRDIEVKYNGVVFGYTLNIPPSKNRIRRSPRLRSQGNHGILIMTASTWEQRRKETTLDVETDCDALAVIILQEKKTNPSSPVDITYLSCNAHSPPIYLVTESKSNQLKALVEFEDDTNLKCIGIRLAHIDMDLYSQQYPTFNCRLNSL